MAGKPTQARRRRRKRREVTERGGFVLDRAQEVPCSQEVAADFAGDATCLREDLAALAARAREALEEWPETPGTGELRTMLLDAAACASAASMRWHDIAARFNALASAAEHAHLVDGSVVGSSHDALDDFSDEIATRPF